MGKQKIQLEWPNDQDNMLFRKYMMTIDTPDASGHDMNERVKMYDAVRDGDKKLMSVQIIVYKYYSDQFGDDDTNGYYIVKQTLDQYTDQEGEIFVFSVLFIDKMLCYTEKTSTS